MKITPHSPTDPGEKNLPDFFIVGAAKSATTSLYSYLQQHPRVFLPAQKELYFFSYNGAAPRFKLADDTVREPVGCTAPEYFRFYENCPAGSLAGDTTSWYLYYHKEVIANIKNLYGRNAEKLKIIMVLRNPIDRAWSHYSMHKGQGLIGIPFSEAIEGKFRDRITNPANNYYPGYDYIGFGMYAAQVKAYLDAFPHVKIYLYEEVNKNAPAVVNDMFEFLDLAPLEELKDQKRLNVSGAPRSRSAAFVSRMLYRPYAVKKVLRSILPARLRYKIKMNVSRFLFKRQLLSSRDRETLVQIYRDDIRQLGEIIGKDLSGWLTL